MELPRAEHNEQSPVRRHRPTLLVWHSCRVLDLPVMVNEAHMEKRTLNTNMSHFYLSITFRICSYPSIVESYHRGIIHGNKPVSLAGVCYERTHSSRRRITFVPAGDDLNIVNASSFVCQSRILTKAKRSHRQGH